MTTEQTKLIVINNTSQDLSVYLTLGDVTKCIHDINLIPFITKPINALQGSFILDPKGSSNDRVSYTSPSGKCFNGNFSFGTPPVNCPPPEYPNGVNLAEFMLNSNCQGNLAQEAIDISAVAGVNAYLRFSMTDGGTWGAGPIQPVTTFGNKTIGKNVGQVGVFPYACDDCTASVSPPYCLIPPVDAPNPPIPQKEPICNVQRNPKESGGIVQIEFNGFV